MIDLGTVRPGSTIRIPFSSFDKDDGSAITMTNYAAADILIYKDGSTTERASTAGFTATTDFDTKTGKHVAVIDLADNTTAGFYAAGSEYLVAIDSVTVDAVTVGGWIGRFRIGYEGSWFDTTIASLTNQTSFTLTAGPAEDDALNGCSVIIHDVASAVQCGRAIISDYTGSTKTVTLAAGTTFTAAATDNISIMHPMPLQPAVAARTLAVGTSGQADANVTQFGGTNLTASGGRPEVNVSHIAGSAVNTASAQLGVNVVNIAGSAVNTASAQLGVNVVNFGGAAGTFASGRPEVNTTHIAGSAVNTASAQLGVNVVQISADAVAADNLETMLDGTGGQALTATFTGNLTGSVASVSGNVGGNVTGSVGSVATGGIAAASFAAGAIDAAAIAANAIGNSEVADGFLTAAKFSTGAITSSAVSQTYLDAVWDSTIEGSVTARQSLRLANSANGGLVSGAGTTSVSLRDLANTKNRVVAAVDASGNRSTITLDLA